MEWTETLDRYAPEIAQQIKQHAARPLAAYAREVMRVGIAGATIPWDIGRRHVEATLLRMHDGRSCRDVIKDALAEHWQCPVLHTGPHVQLYADALTFSMVAFAQLAAREVGQRFCWFLPCSTVTMESGRFEGPGWLAIDATPVNVFGLSRRLLTRRCVCTLEGPVQFRFQPVDDRVAEVADGLRQWLGAEEHRNAAAAFHSANRLLMDRWIGRADEKQIVMDDDFAAELVIEHLQDPDSILGRCLFNSRRCHVLHETIRRLGTEWPSPLVRYPTDMFWLVRDGRTRKLTLMGNQLIEDSPNGGATPIPMDRETIIGMLRRRELYPNTYINFFASAILTGSKLLGGARQSFYMRGLVAAFSSVLSNEVSDERTVLSVLHNAGLDGWVAGAAWASPSDWDALLHPIRADGALDRICERLASQSLLATSEGFRHLKRSLGSWFAGEERGERPMTLERFGA